MSIVASYCSSSAPLTQQFIFILFMILTHNNNKFCFFYKLLYLLLSLTHNCVMMRTRFFFVLYLQYFSSIFFFFSYSNNILKTSAWQLQQTKPSNHHRRWRGTKKGVKWNRAWHSVVNFLHICMIFFLCKVDNEKKIYMSHTFTMIWGSETRPKTMTSRKICVCVCVRYVKMTEKVKEREFFFEQKVNFNIYNTSTDEMSFYARTRTLVLLSLFFSHPLRIRISLYIDVRMNVFEKKFFVIFFCLCQQKFFFFHQFFSHRNFLMYENAKQ